MCAIQCCVKRHSTAPAPLPSSTMSDCLCRDVGLGRPVSSAQCLLRGQHMSGTLSDATRHQTRVQTELVRPARCDAPNALCTGKPGVCEVTGPRAARLSVMQALKARQHSSTVQFPPKSSRVPLSPDEPSCGKCLHSAQDKSSEQCAARREPDTGPGAVLGAGPHGGGARRSQLFADTPC